MSLYLLPHLRNSKPFTNFLQDGGPDQYDLPPPEPVAAGGKAGPATNGVPPEPEEDWSKLGWAPRFGSGETEEDKEGNLLDHQTLLESKLDDRFYGGMHPSSIDRGGMTEKFRLVP